MKVTKIALSALITLFTFAASADIQPIPDGTEAKPVADAANDIHKVINLKVGNVAYKIVSMDSILNGDISATTIVLVGENGVGGLAGYDSAFQLSPTTEVTALKSARVNGDKLELKFYNFDGKVVKKMVRYDQASKLLKE